MAVYVPTSRSKLPLSKEEAQLQLTQKDLDLRGIALSQKGKSKFDFERAILSGDVERTIDGASVVRIRVLDRERFLRNSGYLQSEVDILIDGLYFRLVRVEKEDDVFTLEFEDREVSILRTYDEEKMVEWGKTTRQWFIWNLIREVKEFKIPVTIEGLNSTLPITKSGDKVFLKPKGVKAVDRDYGLEQSYVRDPSRPGQVIPYLTVKGDPADPEQLNIAEIILDTGVGTIGLTHARLRKLLVCSIMTAIVESTIHNYMGGDADSRGVFQQRKSQGWPATRIVEVDAAAFFAAAVAYDQSHPNAPYWLVCADVQRPREDLRRKYADYRTEAERFVQAYGIVGGDKGTPSALTVANNQEWLAPVAVEYQYTRGTPTEDEAGNVLWAKEDKENTWDCTRRMAEEINWRRFMVSGRFYFVSEPYLFKSKPRAVINEKTPGVDRINYVYDIGQDNASVTVEARIDRWAAPPGTVVQIDMEGPVNGKWLVETVSRPIFNNKGKITLKKPRAKLPEPTKEELERRWGTPVAGDDWLPPNIPGNGTTRGGLVRPLPGSIPNTSAFNTPDPEGAPDRFGIRRHSALDWFAPAGTQVVSPAAGKIIEVRTAADVASTSSNPGQVFGGVVKVQMTNGQVWVFRHVDPYGPLRVGAEVQQGAPLATVYNGPTAEHVHIEVWKTAAGGYNHENMLDPVKVMNGSA